MPRRYYSSTAARTTLSSSINSSATSITVASTSGFPGSQPFTLILDQDSASEEIVTVTAVAGTTLTVTRGVDGTTAVSHSSGAIVNHGVSAQDFDESNAFINTMTTKGDLLSRSTSVVTRIPVGADGFVLTADSTEATGVKWAVSTGGGGFNPFLLMGA